MHLVEDPPWARSQKSWDVDYIGIGLIALGLGSLQIVMDRGEDEDWFGSNLILTFATLAALGILGAIAWLLYAKKPVINIRVFADRNFAISAGLMATMAVILYASVNLIPELAQQQLGYDSTHAGMVLSPGAIVVIILIPIVARLESLVATKYLIATGFVILGTAMFYSRAALTPDASYGELVIMRMAQVSGLAFLFAPLTTTAYSNFSEAESGDATALFTMARNVSGSIGVSLATAMVVERTQVRMAHLAPHMTPLDQGYAASLHQYQQAILGLGGRAISGIEQTATGLIYQAFRSQAAILAYIDVFTLCGIAAFCAAPMALFLASHTGGGTHAE
jgi:DHA2 family multidrug resistance protein